MESEQGEPNCKKIKMSGPTRWGIVTAGYISADFAISISTLSQEEHQVVAIASRSQEKSEEFAKRFDIPRAYGSYEDLAKDKDIDVVYIGTIPTMQHPLSLLYLKAGYNVVCENPFTMNIREVRELVQVAREKQLFLMECNQGILCPASVELRSNVSRGGIGTPRFVTADAGVDLRERAEKEWPHIKGVSGLLSLSLGRTGIFFAQTIYGHEKPEKITANSVYDGKDGVSDSVAITLIYSNNRIATVNCSSSVFLDNCATVYGSGGPSGTMLKLDCMYCPGKISYFMSEPKSFPIPRSDKFKTTFPKGESLQFVAKSVRECLLKGLKENPVVSLDQSILTTEIVEEVRKQIGLVYDADQ